MYSTLWEEYHGPRKAARPQGAPSRGGREVASREQALLQFPVGTEVGREFADNSGKIKTFRGRIIDFSDPYWRVEYPDGDWEELTRREVIHGMGVATQPPVNV